MATSALAALASVTVVRPDGPAIPPGLDRAVRAACDQAWLALAIALAGDELRAPIGNTESRLRDGTLAVLDQLGGAVPGRRDALGELLAARRAGELDAGLELPALAATCARHGDAPAVAAHRRRVRTLAIDELRRALAAPPAARPALSAALRESSLAGIVVDAARTAYRLATRAEKDLGRWAAPPTGTTTREQALATFVQLASDAALVGELERQLAPFAPAPPPVATPPVIVEAPAPQVAPPVVADPPPVAADARKFAASDSAAMPPIVDEPPPAPAEARKLAATDSAAMPPVVEDPPRARTPTDSAAMPAPAPAAPIEARKLAATDSAAMPAPAPAAPIEARKLAATDSAAMPPVVEEPPRARTPTDSAAATDSVPAPPAPAPTAAIEARKRAATDSAALVPVAPPPAAAASEARKRAATDSASPPIVEPATVQLEERRGPSIWPWVVLVIVAAAAAGVLLLR